MKKNILHVSGPRRQDYGFTLIELTVALGILALIVPVLGGIFISAQKVWYQHKTELGMIQDTRWAVEFMSNEIRNGENLRVDSADRIRFEMPPGGVFRRVWYWRGNNGNAGSEEFIYRGEGTWASARNHRRELVCGVVSNPSSNDLFTDAGDEICTIELTTRPNPAQPEGSGNKNYTLRTSVRVRN